MSHIGDLTKQIQAKRLKEQEEISRLAREEYEKFRRNLLTLSTNVLDTIESAIIEKTQKPMNDIMRCLNSVEGDLKSSSKNLMKAWFRTTATALALTIGIGGGAWAILCIAAQKVETLRDEVSTLVRQQKDLEASVDILERQTWGVRLVENQGSRFIVLSPKITAHHGWTVGKNSALKLE